MKYRYELETMNSIVVINEDEERICEIVSDDDTTDEDIDKAKLIVDALNAFKAEEKKGGGE
jgi:hypothetical protein